MLQVGCADSSKFMPPILANCPKPSGANSLLPAYGIDNKVAEFYPAIRFKGELGDSFVVGEKQYLMRAYSLHSRKAKMSAPLSVRDINKFFITGGFEIIEIFEYNLHGRWYLNPSAIVYITELATYVIKNTGRKTIENKISSVTCYGHFHPNVVWKTGEDIIKDWIIEQKNRRDKEDFTPDANPIRGNVIEI